MDNKITQTAFTINDIQTLTNRIDKNIEINNQTIDEYKNRIDVLSKQLNSSKTLFDVSNKRLKQLIQEKEQLQNSCKLPEKEMSEINKTVQMLIQTARSNSNGRPINNLGDVQEAYKSWIEKSDELEKEIEKQRQTFAQVNSQLLDSKQKEQNAIQQLNEQIEVALKNESLAQQELEKNQKQIQQLAQRVTGLENRMVGLVNEHQKEIEQLISKHETEIEQNQLVYKQLNEKYTQIQNQLTQKDSNISELQSLVDRIPILENQIENYSESIDLLRDELEEKEREVEEQQQDIKTKNEKIAALDTQIKDIKTKILVLTSENTDLENIKQNYEGYLETLTRKIGELKTNNIIDHSYLSTVTEEATDVYVKSGSVSVESLKDFVNLTNEEKTNILLFFNNQTGLSNPKSVGSISGTPYNQYQHAALYARMKGLRGEELQKFLELRDTPDPKFESMIFNFVPTIHV
jgi:chromosome segregation ATPase